MMNSRQAAFENALQRMSRYKAQQRQASVPLGGELISFFKQSVQKRQTKLAKVSECWGAIMPEALNDHCALESLSRGTLTVVVDSSAHLYELKQLLLAGLQQQLLIACKSAGLRKITLKQGRWYTGDHTDAKLRF
jgi:hypothetical protein